MMKVRAKKMNEYLKKDIKQKLDEIYDLLISHPLMQPLNNLVSIEVAAVGGCIRDLVLNKPVKDIDISISLNFFHNLKVYYPKSSKEDDMYDEKIAEVDALQSREYEILQLFKNNRDLNSIFNISEKKSMQNFLNNHLIWIPNSVPDSAIKAVVKLITHIVETSPKYQIDKKFDQEMESGMTSQQAKLKEVAYSNLGLNAVLALKSKESKLPLELLVTTSSPEKFIDCFDFNLCRIYMEQSTGQIIQTEEFKKDVLNKHMTYLIKEKTITEQQVKKSLFIRYPRLYEKFDDYKLMYDTSHIEDENIKKLIHSSVLSISLNRDLKENKGNKENKRKI